MSYELRIERLFDATPEEVFDAFVDADTQEELHGSGQSDWKVHRTETDVRVGGTSVYVMGPEGGEADTETRTYSVSIARVDWSSCTGWTSPSGAAASRPR